MPTLQNRTIQFLLLLFLFQISGCGNTKLDPELQKARKDTIEIFDKLSAAEQEGFLTTFRSTAEKVANKSLSGSELKTRLKFINDLDAELRRRKK